MGHIMGGVHTFGTGFDNGGLMSYTGEIEIYDNRDICPFMDTGLLAWDRLDEDRCKVRHARISARAYLGEITADGSRRRDLDEIRAERSTRARYGRALSARVQVLQNPTCGNGVVEGGEKCDDGNTANGDGCSAACELECGWMCTNTPGFSSPSDGSSSVTSVCEIGCGNGRVDYELGEECDETSECCVNCKFANGVACGGTGTCHKGSCIVVTPTCGNGVVEKGEECDDTTSGCCTGACKFASDANCSPASPDSSECCSSTCQKLSTRQTCGDSGKGYCDGLGTCLETTDAFKDAVRACSRARPPRAQLATA